MKVPLPLMTDEYLKNAYRRCTEIILGNFVIMNEDGRRVSFKQEAPLSLEAATEWKEIFEKEAKLRNIRLPKVDKDTYSYRLGKTVKLRKYMRNRNKKFDIAFE